VQEGQPRQAHHQETIQNEADEERHGGPRRPHDDQAGQEQERAQGSRPRARREIVGTRDSTGSGSAAVDTIARVGAVPAGILILTGACTGLVGALLGLGGGVFLVPILTLVLGVPIRPPLPASLISVIATASALRDREPEPRPGEHAAGPGAGGGHQRGRAGGGITPPPTSPTASSSSRSPRRWPSWAR
jgi:hypothetical protein